MSVERFSGIDWSMKYLFKSFEQGMSDSQECRHLFLLSGHKDKVLVNFREDRDNRRVLERGGMFSTCSLFCYYLYSAVA